MYTYIILLRAVNVLGHNKMKMDVLRECLASLNLSNISTYIQSGNLVFNSENTDTTELKKIVENAINKQFGYKVTVFVKNVMHFTEISANNPYINERNEDKDRLYVTFFSDIPDKEHILKLSGYLINPDEFIIKSDFAYLYVASGYGKTKINNGFFEKNLKIDATTRNWKTINKLLSMAGNNNK